MVKLDRRVARSDAEIAYSDTGTSGRPVVLTHGAGVDHTMFDDQVTTLAEHGYRVIVWDLRGHGESTLSEKVPFTADAALADLDAVLIACRVDMPVLVGHSLGGNLAQAFARMHPYRVSGVVVMDSTWNSGPLSLGEHLALRLAAPTLAAIPSRPLARLMARASAVTPEAIARTEALFSRMPKSRFLEVWKATTSFVSPQPGLTFPVPLALLRGAEDRTGNIATSMTRWATAEGVVEHVIPRAGHIVTWDAPTETSQTLLEILDAGENAVVGEERRS